MRLLDLAYVEELANKDIYQLAKEQRQWLDNESKRTGNSQASVIRQLIQREVDALNSLVGYAKEGA